MQTNMTVAGKEVQKTAALIGINKLLSIVYYIRDHFSYFISPPSFILTQPRNWSSLESLTKLAAQRSKGRLPEGSFSIELYCTSIHSFDISYDNELYWNHITSMTFCQNTVGKGQIAPSIIQIPNKGLSSGTLWIDKSSFVSYSMNYQHMPWI